VRRLSLRAFRHCLSDEIQICIRSPGSADSGKCDGKREYRPKNSKRRMHTMHVVYCLSFALVWTFFTTPALAQQSYPSRSIRLVVSWAPGGASDLIARVVGEKLGEQLGQQIVIDNRAGASGAIGTQMAAKGAPDGYTLLFGGVTELVLNPQIVKVPYDPMRDFTAVSPAAFGYYVMVTHPALPAKSVRELIALAKSRPGEINYASGGSGSNLALVAELFRTKAGIQVAHVPYKGGGPAGLR
jgi:tripartite-type tricarboxylate transporter receptor subunit TctC